MALAENAGLDPVNVLVDLRAQHGKGEIWAGVYAEGGVRDSVKDMAKLGVYEPLVVKEQIIKSASEVASMISEDRRRHRSREERRRDHPKRPRRNGWT